MPVLKRVIISVTSDLVTDQRVHKVAATLQGAGNDVLLFGRKKSTSADLPPLPYRSRRTRLLFESGFLFYAVYNIRLFFFLLFTPADVYIANDLDTLLPNFLVARLKKKKLLYDNHEYFTGVPELSHRPGVRKIWKKIEQYIFPKLETVYTVNQSVSKLYEEEYKVPVHVVRNLPYFVEEKPASGSADTFGVLPAKHSETAVILNLVYECLKKIEKRKIIIYQGAINVDRGIEEMMAAMQWVDNACFLVIGGGDLYKQLRAENEKSAHGDRVIFTGPVPFQYLRYFTELATLGISFEKPTNINYTLASPNKVVDYIHSGVPVLASQLFENVQLFSQFSIGTFIDNHDPGHIAAKVNEVLANETQMGTWKANCQAAAPQLAWQNEAKKLLALV